MQQVVSVQEVTVQVRTMTKRRRAAYRPVMTYDIAMAIFKDTANRAMRKGGRTAWSEEDYNAGVDAFNRCLPEQTAEAVVA